jgi:HEAT repeat protein
MDRTIEVRIAVVEALGFIGGSLALTVLSEALKDRAPVIRIRAVEALKDAGTVNAIPILQKAFGDKESSVRLHVALMLRKIGHKDAHGALTYDLDSGLAHQILDHRSGTEYRARCRGLVDQYHYGPQAQRRRHDKRFS